MTNSVVDQLPAASALTGTEILYAIQGGADVQTTAQDIANLGGGAVDSVNGQTGVVVLDTGDIAEAANLNYVSDAQLVVIGNTSGTNTGDQTITLTGDVTGTGTGTFAATVKNNLKLNAVQGVFDGGGSAIDNGSTAYAIVPYAGTITAYTILADTGTCTIKTWKKATGTAIPTVSDSISTSGVSLSSGTLIRSTTLTDFTTTAVAANDVFAFNITAISGATKITFMLEITRT